ncbi:MAG: hypothetical protein HPY50_14030 [Firmicutes bacterium]|nr:hypothetical protein [Bacillota bacterium]
MVEDEKLFVRLYLLGKRPENSGELIKAGYTEANGSLTEKAREFLDGFISKHKERLYQAMRDENNDIPKAMDKAGLEYYLSFLYIGEQLFREGLFYKDEQLEFRVNVKM